jgi:hypothetical protein
MQMTQRHRRLARTVWECGGRLEEAAQRQNIKVDTLRRWLADPEFRMLMAQEALEPLLQATSAMLRWAPVAVARLIQDLEGESAADARQAAREILKLALETQRELSPPSDREARARKDVDPEAILRDDPLGRRVAAMTDDQLAKVLAIINASTPDRHPEPRA